MNSGDQNLLFPRCVTITYTSEAIPADHVAIETLHTLKYLCLRNGDCKVGLVDHVDVRLLVPAALN